MNVLEILEENIKNVPLGATAYNFHRGCFTKKDGVLEYCYYEPANSWRIFTGTYDKTYSIQLLPCDIFDLITNTNLKLISLVSSAALEHAIREKIKIINLRELT
ncbi:hypothetical protein [Acinetobacter higginsii]|uniref:hypothetical protein n=1 Tax=Acinetobacter higginsii TaxID=70347 RepID=UPI0026764E74|nr:hypothetical protein [Acinetobacter higginsii]MDO3663438.1 hypothetical protein [Acinetobacter higginsii]